MSMATFNETNHKRWRGAQLLIAGLCLLFAAGCLETPDTSGETTCEPGAGDCAPSDTDRTRYPGFGTEPGEVIAPLVFQNGDGSDYGLQNIFTDPTRKVLLMTTSAGWCTACIEEQPKLQSLHNEFGEQGLAIMVVLFEKEDYTPADARMARIWKSRYNLDFSVVADPEFTMQPYYPNNDASATPVILIIDVDTMTILDTMVGFQEASVRALITNNL